MNLKGVWLLSANLLMVACITIKDSTAALPCNEQYLECENSLTCIPAHYFCDGTPDCIDSSDEDPATCTDFCVSLYRNYLISYEVSKIPGLNTTPLRDVRIGFSTKKKAGILMQIQTSSGSSISLTINNSGGVKFSIDDRENDLRYQINTLTTSWIDYTDGQQHVVHLWRTGNNSEMIHLQVDNEVVSTSYFPFPYDQIVHNAKYIYIGNNATETTYNGFEGCIYEMKIDKFNALKGIFKETKPNYMTVEPKNPKGASDIP